MSCITSDYWISRRIREQLPEEQLVILCLDNICCVFGQGHALGREGKPGNGFLEVKEVPGDLQ